MTEVNDKCLEIFPSWLQSLGEDLSTLVSALKQENISDDAKRYFLGGINYLFKSLDLIPDGIDDIGYLDDAFVMRLSVKAALESDIGTLDEGLIAKLTTLSKGCVLLEDFLGQDIYNRLDRYTRNLRKGAARGRMVEELMENERLLGDLFKECDTFVQEFESPNFAKDEKNLIKLTAFFEAKLPK